MIRNYFRIAFRNLWKHKWFSLINIAGITMGLTAGFLIFLYVNFETSYDKFHSKADRIYRVVANIKTPSETIEADRPAWPIAPNLKSEFPEIESAVRVMNVEALVRNNDLKFREENIIAGDSSFFKIFDFELLQGNKNTVLKSPFSVVLSETTARKYFGNINPIGHSLKIFDEGYAAEVTGIMKDFPLNSQILTDMVISMTTFTEVLDKGVDEQWGGYNPAAYILLKPKTNPDRLTTKFPDFLERKNGTKMRESQMFVTLLLERYTDVYLHSKRGGDIQGNITNVYLLSFVALFILLIACINFINLTTARSVERAKEVGIRKVVGAQKSQLAFQFIGESVILCIVAFLLTIGLVALLLPYFNTMAGKIVAESILSIPIYLLFLLLVAVLLGLIAGVYPAIILSSFKPASVLKGRFSGGNMGVLLRKGLVISQFTVSIILIIGTIIIYNQMNFMRNTDLGFNKDQVIVLRPNGHQSQYALQQSITELPEIKSTSFGSSIPGGNNYAAYSEIENEQGDLQIANLDVYFVDFDYIPLFDLEVVAGRAFSRDFTTDTSQAMIINERAVQLFGYSSPENALGRRFRQWGREGKIVGVVKDFHITSLQEEILPLTMRMEPERNTLLTIKANSLDMSKTIASLEEKWNTFLPEQPFDYYFLDEFFDRHYRSEERFGHLFFNFAILAIFISCLGLLGLVSYSTVQRKREISIRKIIGSSVPGIVNLLSRDFIRLVGIAFLIASPLAWLGAHYWLKHFAHRISIEWWVFLVAGIAAMTISLLTIGFQVIKAAIANPAKNLRTE